MRLKAILAVMCIAIVMVLGCAASRNDCAKATKPSPAIVRGNTMLDNADWHCAEFGIDAKTKRLCYVCTNKHSGSRVLITPID